MAPNSRLAVLQLVIISCNLRVQCTALLVFHMALYKPVHVHHLKWTIAGYADESQ